MPDHNLLPTEIWIEILEWVFTSESSVVLEHIPLQNPSPRHYDFNLTDRRCLPLVCRNWRDWSYYLLYREIQVIPRTADALKHALERSPGYGKWVRRVVLPYSSTTTGPSRSLTSIEILRLCANLQTLVRPLFRLPEALQFEFDAEDVPMPSLRRLEWWQHSEAERSGGINSLGSVLRNAPNIQYLLVAGVGGQSRVAMQREPVCLPALQTLRLHIMNGSMLRQIVMRWSLPSLTRFVLESPVAIDHGVDSIWETFGPQLRTVEFGKHVRFLLDEYITPCLQGCPNLEELDYFLFFTTIPALTDVVHKSLTKIGLHAAVNSFISDGAILWNHLEGHFDILSGDTSLPALQRITLYGNWNGIITNPRFKRLRDQLHDRGVMVQLNSVASII